MGSAVTKIASLGDHRPIPFDKLELSQSNVRRIKSGISIDDLAEDIARRGLLENLNVRPVLDDDGNETGRFNIPAGGRRFQALGLLVEAKRLAKTAPIPCNIRAADSAIPAEEDSLAENVQQVALHPLDQFRAFKSLVDGGASIEDVAARFFVNAGVVRQRLRLASVHPHLLDCYGADEMTLELLMAFTVSTDHERQLQVWEDVQRSSYRQPHYVRRSLTEGAVAATDRRAVYVGVEAYELAGGLVTRDLFEQDRGGWFDDPVLLDELAAQKLTDDATALSAEGWKWIDAALSFDHDKGAGMRRVYGRRPERSEQEQAEHDARVEELDQLYALHEGEDDVGDDVIVKVEALEALVEAFNNPALIFEPSEIAQAGVFVSLGNDGALRIERGFVRPEDQQVDEPSDSVAGKDGGGGSGTVVTIGGAAAGGDDDIEEGEVLKPLSDRLVTELTAFRTFALRDAVAKDPEVAHLAILHVLVLSTFYHSAQDSCLEVTRVSASFSTAAPDLDQTDPAVAIEARQQFWAARLPKEREQVWATLVEFGPDERQMLFAHCASLSINVTEERFNRRPRALVHGEVLAKTVDLDLVAAGWKPTGSLYLSKVTKARILEAVREGKGEMAAQLIDHLKKPDMAKEAERLLGDSGWLPELLRPKVMQPEPAAVDEEALPDFLTAASDDEAGSAVGEEMAVAAE